MRPHRFVASLTRLLSIRKLTHKCFIDLPKAILRGFLRASQRKPRGECFIRKLPQSLLCDIFKHLPLEDRLRASEVCVAWRDASRMKWTDVVNIDLTPIPSDCIPQILKQCPSLKHVTAHGKALPLSSLRVLASLSLSSLKLYDCHSVRKLLSQEAIPELRQCSELVLHDTNRYALPEKREKLSFLSRWSSCPGPIAFQLKSLKRLQLSGQHIYGYSNAGSNCAVLDLRRVSDLECVIFNGVSATSRRIRRGHFMVSSRKFHALMPQRLRELSLGFDSQRISKTFAAHLFDFASLPLEVLFLRDVTFTEAVFRQLVLEHCTLRILVITGYFYVKRDDFHYDADILIPARNLFSTNGTPLQRLNVFFGGYASKRIRFTPSPEALTVHPIDEPMPQFLQRADIAPIFEGVWIAEKILEGAQCGAKLWGYNNLYG